MGHLHHEISNTSGLGEEKCVPVFFISIPYPQACLTPRLLVGVETVYLSL